MRFIVVLIVSVLFGSQATPVRANTLLSLCNEMSETLYIAVRRQDGLLTGGGYPTSGWIALPPRGLFRSCERWNVSRRWEIHFVVAVQRADGFVKVDFDLRNRWNRIRASAFCVTANLTRFQYREPGRDSGTCRSGFRREEASVNVRGGDNDVTVDLRGSVPRDAVPPIDEAERARQREEQERAEEEARQREAAERQRQERADAANTRQIEGLRSELESKSHLFLFPRTAGHETFTSNGASQVIAANEAMAGLIVDLRPGFGIRYLDPSGILLNLDWVPQDSLELTSEDLNRLRALRLMSRPQETFWRFEYFSGSLFACMLEKPSPNSPHAAVCTNVTRTFSDTSDALESVAFDGIFELKERSETGGSDFQLLNLAKGWAGEVEVLGKLIE